MCVCVWPLERQAVYDAVEPWLGRERLVSALDHLCFLLFLGSHVFK